MAVALTAICLGTALLVGSSVMLTLGYYLFGMQVRQQVGSPDARYIASTLYGFGEHGVGLERAGYHPFGLNRDDAYDLGELHVNVTVLKWQDNHTLLVGYNDKGHQYHFGPRHWHDVTIIPYEDSKNRIDPFAHDGDRFD